MIVHTRPPVSTALKRGDRAVLRGMAVRQWLVDVTPEQAVRLLGRGYIVPGRDGYEITKRGRRAIGFTEIDG